MDRHEKNTRRPLQFRIRTLLVLTAFAAAFLGFLSSPTVVFNTFAIVGAAILGLIGLAYLIEEIVRLFRRPK